VICDASPVTPPVLHTVTFVLSVKLELAEQGVVPGDLQTRTAFLPAAVRTETSLSFV